MVSLAVEVGVRILVFGVVFWLVARRNPRVRIEPRWALPVVALVFGVANASLYWLLRGLVVMASLWTLTVLAPLLANGALVYATDRVLKPLKIEGFMPMVWLSVALTAAHLAVTFGFQLAAG